MVLIESMFFPPVNVIAELIRNDTIVLERHEHYQKRSFRNRVYLKSSQKRTLFTVPLTKGKNNKQPITRCHISYEEDWILLFGRLLQSDYGNAPFYIYYIDELMTILNSHAKNLYLLNKLSLLWCLDKLGIDREIKESTTFIKPADITHSTDLRNKYLPNNDFFASKEHIIYPQIYEEKNGFMGGLSILDMLFCCGPESLLYIKSK